MYLPERLFDKLDKIALEAISITLGYNKKNDLACRTLWKEFADMTVGKDVLSNTRFHYMSRRKERMKDGIIPVLGVFFSNLMAFIQKTNPDELQEPKQQGNESDTEAWGRVFLSRYFPNEPNLITHFFPKKKMNNHNENANSDSDFKASGSKKYSMGNGSAADLQAAMSCVENYYRHLSAKETKEAWELMGPNFRDNEVHKNSYKRFHNGFVNTCSIKDICAFNAVRTSPSIIECLVYYLDEMMIYPINGLQGIRLMCVDELEDFTTALKKMENDISNKGGTEFGRIKLGKLFEPVGTEYIWWECGLKGKELYKHFPKPSAETERRLSKCKCIFENGKWLIDIIVSLSVYKIR